MATSLALIEVRTVDEKIGRYFPSGRLRQLFKALDGDRDWAGAGVVFVPDSIGKIERSIAEGRFTLLRNRKSDFIQRQLRNGCRADGKTLYIREILPQTRLSRAKVIEQTRSTLGRELLATGWSCTGAAIGWVLIISEVGAGT